MESTTEFSTALAHGVWAIDTGYQRANFDAAYLIVERGRAAFIDTGTGHSVPRLLAVLEAAGVAREAVQVPGGPRAVHRPGGRVDWRAAPVVVLGAVRTRAAAYGHVGAKVGHVSHGRASSPGHRSVVRAAAARRRARD